MDYSAEILTIGDEILYGQIIDTNSAWLSSELSQLGITVKRKFSVGDNKEEILSVLGGSIKRSNLIIITGGLGPTNDDITKNTLCEVFNSRLKLDENTLNVLEDFFSKKGKTLTERNKDQALVPEGCEVLANYWGTAPGILLKKDDCFVVALPGVPYEMKNIFTEHLVPFIKEKFKTPFILHRFVKTAGIGESYLADLIENWEKALPEYVKLAYLPSPGQVKLRLTAKGDNKKLLEESIEQQILSLKKIAGKYVFGYDLENIESLTGKALKIKGLKLTTAESCTGGFIGHLITSIPGSSEWYKGGVIAYDNSVKQSLLGVKKETLTTYGAVSEQTVFEMAEGARKILNSDIGISSSGIAGPGGGTPDKPVGTVWIAVSGPKQTLTKKLILGTDRSYNIKASGTAALSILLESLEQII